MPIDPAALELAREILSKERCSKGRDCDFDVTPYFYDRLVPFAAALLEAEGEIEALYASLHHVNAERERDLQAYMTHITATQSPVIVQMSASDWDNVQRARLDAGKDSPDARA